MDQAEFTDGHTRGAEQMSLGQASGLDSVDQSTRELRNNLESFLATKKLFDLIQGEARKAAGSTKFNRNAADLVYFFSLHSMAIFADQVGERTFVLNQIKKDLGEQPIDTTSRRIPETATVVERLYRHASEEEKQHAVSFFTEALWEATQKIPNLEARSRAVTGMLEQLAKVIQSSPQLQENGKKFIEEIVLLKTRETFQAQRSTIKEQNKKEIFSRIESKAFGGILAAYANFYSFAETPQKRFEAEKILGHISHYAKTIVSYPEAAESADISIRICRLRLNQDADHETKKAFIGTLAKNPIRSSFEASRYYEAVARFFTATSTPSKEQIDSIVQYAIIPAKTISDEVHRTITLPRIANVLCEMALQGERALAKYTADTLEQLKQELTSSDEAKNVAERKSEYEVIAKLNRAIESLKQIDLPSFLKEGSLFLTAETNQIKNDPDAFSRQIAGVAENLAARSSVFSTEERAAVADYVTQELIPLVEQLPSKITQDHDGQQFIDETAKGRAFSRIAISLAKLFQNSTHSERIQAEALIREKILAPMSRYAQLNKSYLERVQRNYQACISLLRGPQAHTQTLWTSIGEAQLDVTLFAEQLSNRDRSELYVSLGAFAPRLFLVNLLEDASLSNADKGAVIYGRFFFHQTFPLNSQIKILHPLPDPLIESFTAKIRNKDITSSDRMKLSNYVSAGQRAKNWGEIAELTTFCARDPETHINILRSLLISLRLKQHTQESGSRKVNIEQIPKLLMPGLSALFSHEASATSLLPETRALVRALPLDSFLINEIRIESYKLFDDKLVPVSAQFLTVLRTVFHNLPSPRHLLVMRALVDYLENDSSAARSQIDLLLRDYQSQYAESILVPSDFIDQLGSARQEMLEGAKKVRDLYEDLYGEQQARAIIRTLLDRRNEKLLPSKVSSKAKALLVNISQLTQLDTIPTLLAKTFKSASSYPPSTLVAVTKELADLREEITKSIVAPGTEGEARIYLLRLQNAAEPLVFSFLNSLRDTWAILNAHDRKSALISVIRIAKQDLASTTSEYRELELIADELESTSEFHPLKTHAVLMRLQRVCGRIADHVVETFQARVEFESRKLEIEARDIQEFSANLLRESTLYPLQLLLEQALENDTNGWKITRGGKATGSLVYIENPEDFSTLSTLKGNEIIVLDHISPHLEFPNVRGIITRSGTTALSHLAIHAGQHHIPWASPSRKEYEQIVAQAKSQSAENPSFFEFSATPNEVRLVELDQIEVTKSSIEQLPNLNSRQIRIFDLSNDGPSILAPEEYDETNVGIKALKLSKLSLAFPDKVPPHFTIPFGTVERFLQSDATLLALIRELPFVQDQDLSGKLAIIQKTILSTPFSTNLENEIHAALKKYFSPSDTLICRSASSIEDAKDYAGAGDYASTVIHDKSRIFDDIKYVIASLYSIKAFRERKKNGFEEAQSKMSVILQKLIAPDVDTKQYGFVVHTHNPYAVNPENEILIEFTPGLGDALVSGDPFFEGDAHSFSYNRTTGVVTRLRYANKSFMLTAGSKEPVEVDYKEDPFSLSEVPFHEALTNLFKDTLRIETEIGNGFAQDCEGVLLVKDGNLSFQFVQTRPQMGIEKSNQSTQIAEEVIIPAVTPNFLPLSSHPPLFHRNTTAFSAYNLPKEIFNNQSETNLLTLWMSAFNQVLGEGKVLITPVGSLSYMAFQDQMQWKHIDDFDLNFYLPDSRTEWEAWQIEKNLMPKVIQAFKGASLDRGLQIVEHDDNSFSIVGTVDGKERQFQMKLQNLKLLPLSRLSLPLTEIKAPDGFLPWYNFYGDESAQAKFHSLLLSQRDISASLIETNIARQYKFAFTRGNTPSEGGDYRKLKELCRLGIILEDETLREKALHLLESFETVPPQEVENLWRTVPVPTEAILQNHITNSVSTIFQNTTRITSLIENSLAAKRIVSGEDFFYSFHSFAKKNDVPSTIADCLFLTHLRDGKFFLVDWSFDEYRSEVITKLAERLRLAFKDQTREEAYFEAKQIANTRVINFVHYHDQKVMNDWLERYPHLREQSDISHLDFIHEWLREGNRFSPADTALIDHADQGSVIGLFLLLYSKGTHSPEVLNLLKQALYVREKVEGTLEFVSRRVTGDLVTAQKMAFAIEKVIKEVKTGNSPSEEEVRELFLQGQDGTIGIFNRLLDCANAIIHNINDPYVEKASRSGLEQLRSELKRAKKTAEQNNQIGVRAESNQVCAISREDGFREINIQYALAGPETKVLIEYEPIRNTERQTVGWRYLSIGRSPFHPELDLSPLETILNHAESPLHDEFYGKQKNSRWRGRANSSMVIQGPSGVDLERQNFSLLSPSQVIEIVDNYIKE